MLTAMNKWLEVPHFDDLYAVLSATDLTSVLVDPQRDEELLPLLVVDELVHIVGGGVDLELTLHLETLCQVEVLGQVGVLTRLHSLCTQEQKEHIQIDHSHDVDILDGLKKGRSINLFWLFILTSSSLRSSLLRGSRCRCLWVFNSITLKELNPLKTWHIYLLLLFLTHPKI